WSPPAWTLGGRRNGRQRGRNGYRCHDGRLREGIRNWSSANDVEALQWIAVAIGLVVPTVDRTIVCFDPKVAVSVGGVLPDRCLHVVHLDARTSISVCDVALDDGGRAEIHEDAKGSI